MRDIAGVSKSIRTTGCPRKPEQLEDLLAGADAVLSEEMLDRIDEIVPPGTDLNAADNTFLMNPALEDKRLRRR